MRIIWTFTLLMIPGVMSSMNVTGYSGGGVKITCKYEKNYTANVKSFSQVHPNSTCSELIKTETKNQWVNSGRFSLYDNTSSEVLTIRYLSEEDSGTYFCAFDPNRDKDFNTEVKLKVIRDHQIRSVRGYLGGNVMINFKYENKYKINTQICKTGSGQGFTVMNTNRTAEQDQDRRFSVHDDGSAGLLRVFIRELNVNDSGKYKITVKLSENYSVFSEFNLNISKDDCVKSISLSAAAGGSVNISCKYPQSHSSDVKFLCWRSGDDLCAKETSVNESKRWSPEGKIQLYDDREEKILTGRISHVTEQHSEYWCGVQSDQGHKSFIKRVLIYVNSTKDFLTDINKGSSLIIPLVLVLLVVIIAGLLLLIFCKKRQSQGGDSSSQTGPGKRKVVSHTGFDNEEIKDTHKQLPTNPSDSSNCLYATVHKATEDSRCSITSAEDLIYAVVHFNKKSDCPDRVYIRNNQDYSEYAAINQLTA